MWCHCIKHRFGLPLVCASWVLGHRHISVHLLFVGYSAPLQRSHSVVSGNGRLDYVISYVGGAGCVHCTLCRSARDNFTKMLSVKLLFCLLAYCCLYGSGKSAQCEPDEVNPCVARCNYTAFDLSKAFDFP